MNRSENKRKIRGSMAVGFLTVLFTCGLHSLDIGRAVETSGQRWLMENFYVMAFFLLLFLGGLAFWLSGDRYKKNLSFFFMTAGFVLGFFSILIFPPLSAPDESSHYITAYRLSNTLMGQQAVDEHGAVMIRECDRFLEDDMMQQDSDSTVFGKYATEPVYEKIHETGWFTGETNGRMVPSVLPPVDTTPVVYLPQALGFSLARVAGMNWFGLVFMGRLFNLLFYLGIGAAAVFKIPFGKKILCAAGLFPMVLNLTGSLSYDVMILALVWYFCALCLDLAYEKEQVGVLDVISLAAVIAAVGPCKLIYAVILGLCLLIPVGKFKNMGRYILCALIVLGAYCAAMIFVNTAVIARYTASAGNYVAWSGENGYSFVWLIHNPSKVLMLFYQTVLSQGDEWFFGMIGSMLGNMDPVLEVPFLIELLFAFGTLILLLKKPGETVKISGFKRIWIWILCLLCLALAMFSMLLAWTPQSSFVIEGVQGRYLLPLLPVFLVACKNDFLVCTKDRDYEVLYMMCCADAFVLLRMYSVICRRI